MIVSKNHQRNRLIYQSKSNAKFLRFFVITPILLIFSLHSLAQEEQNTSEAKHTDSESSTAEMPKVDRLHLSIADLEKIKQKIFSTELDPADIEVISSGDDEFAVLWQNARGGRTLGAVLFVHGAGQTPDWPGTIDLLRTTLPDFGWATLSVSMPDPLPSEIPGRTTPIPISKEELENQPETKQVETKDKPEAATPTPKSTPMPIKTPRPDIESQAFLRIDTAVKYLHQKGQFNVIIAGEGLGAARISKFVDKKLGNTLKKDVGKVVDSVNTRMVRTMILINARNQIPGETETLPNFLNYLSLPILDIYTHSHYLDQYEPKDRMARAKKNQLENYVQIPMRASDAAAFNKETLLIRRIRGFLEKHAKGVELEKTE